MPKKELTYLFLRYRQDPGAKKMMLEDELKSQNSSKDSVSDKKQKNNKNKTNDDYLGTKK
jgi:hypothetical protein